MTVNELPGATPAGIVATTWVCCACGGGGEDMRNCAAEWLQPWPTRYDLLRLLAPPFRRFYFERSNRQDIMTLYQTTSKGCDNYSRLPKGRRRPGAR